MQLVRRSEISTIELRKLIETEKGLTVLLDDPVATGLVMSLRDENTQPYYSRQITLTLGTILAYQIGQVLPEKKAQVHTPMNETAYGQVSEEMYLVGVLRAGQQLQDGAWLAFPNSPGALMGVSRSHGKVDELVATMHYCSIKKPIDGANVSVLDVMLASAVSSIAAVSKLKEMGAGKIYFGNVIAAPEGIEKFHSVHPDVPLFTFAKDNCLNDVGYIRPGLGDAGDRQFGTK